MSNNKETKDKLNWDNISQLHEAVSNFSKQSFDIKKLWITVEVSVITLLLTLKVGEVKDHLLIAVAILVFFYLLDCMTYYYQDKLRESMSKEQNAIRKRNGITEVAYDRKGCRFIRSMLNWSHLLYYVVFVLGCIGVLLCQYL